MGSPTTTSNNGKVGFIVNKCYGGFVFSQKILDLYVEKTGKRDLSLHGGYPIKCRRDPILVDLVKTLGREASGFCSNLVVEEVDEAYVKSGSVDIEEYDGMESVTYLEYKHLIYSLPSESEMAAMSKEEVIQIIRRLKERINDD